MQSSWSEENIGSPRSIVKNDLPIELIWSEPLINGRPPVQLPVIACQQDYGTSILWLPDRNEWQGTALFDQYGNVLWNRSEDTPRAVAIDEGAVYIFDAPKLRAYEINSGELLWETEEELGFRFSATLFPQGDEIQLLSENFVNIYRTSDGQLVSREKTVYENLVLQFGDFYFYTDGNMNLFATSVSDLQEILWFNKQLVVGRTPQVYDNSLIIYSNATQPVCRVQMQDGNVTWCENKRILSNIAVHNGLGYGINTDFELVAFQLEDGKDVGKVVFLPEGPSPSKVYTDYYVAACNDHLLAYYTSPEELFWFDFTE